MSTVSPGRRRHEFGRRHPVLVVMTLLVAFTVAAHLVPPVVAGPVAVLGLAAAARYTGLTAADLGLTRRTARRGLLVAAACAVAVTAVYLAAAALPLTRPAFLDTRYPRGLAAAAVIAFAVIPLGTVLPEELGFRGLLWAQLARRHGHAAATALSSAAFGLWHVAPSLRLPAANPLVGDLVGGGPTGRVVAVVVAVSFTAVAGAVLCELRRRSDSLLAPVGVHWAINAAGVVIATGLR